MVNIPIKRCLLASHNGAARIPIYCFCFVMIVDEQHKKNCIYFDQ